MKNAFFLFVFISCGVLHAIHGDLSVSIDYGYADQWKYSVGFHPQPPTPTKIIYPQQYFNIYLLLNDYAVGADKKAKVIFDIQIIDSKKKILLDEKNQVALEDTLRYKFPQQLSTTNYNMSLPEGAANGKYTVNLTIYDLIANTTETISTSLQVSKWKATNTTTTIDEFKTWKKNYYQKPQPESAADAFLYFAKTAELNQENSVMWANLYFFMQVFDYNPFLIDELITRYPKQELQTKIYIIFLFNYLSHNTSTFLTKLEGDEKQVYLQIKDQGKPYNLDASPESGEHLDALWGSFMATGKFTFIEHITQCLAWKQYAGSIEKYKESPTDDNYNNAYKESVYKAAQWSLKTNASEYPVIKNYCLYIITQPGLDENIKMDLLFILL